MLDSYFIPKSPFMKIMSCINREKYFTAGSEFLLSEIEKILPVLSC